MKRTIIVILFLILGACSNNTSVIKSINKAGCLITEYHERTKTGEIKIICSDKTL